MDEDIEIEEYEEEFDEDAETERIVMWDGVD